MSGAADDADNNVARSLTMTTLFNRFVKDESGATAIEYGLIAALIAVVVIGTWTTLGTRLNTKFEAVSNGLAN
jgi:pilus assembly protein Flp/PilA